MIHIDDIKKIREAIRNNENDEAMTIISSNPEYLNLITPFGSWLHVAASFGNCQIVERLLASGIDVNNRSGTFKGAAINVAAGYGFLDIVKILYESGSELDVSEPERNPLFAAVQGGYLEVVKYLIACGIDYDVRYTGSSMKNMNSCDFAEEQGKTDIVKYLRSLN